MVKTNSLRLIILLILIFTIIYSLFFVKDISNSGNIVIDYILNNNKIIISIILSSFFMIIAATIRSEKMSSLFNVTSCEKTFRSQLKAFSIGELCNSIMPFRIGELFRAKIIADRLSTSFVYSLVLLVFERVVDGFIIILFSFIIFSTSSNSPDGIEYILTLTAIVIIASLLLLLLRYQPMFFRKFANLSTSILSKNLRAKFLFTFWSLKYGLEKIFNFKTISIFILKSLIHWLFCFSAIFTIIIGFFGNQVFNIKQIIAPFIVTGSAFTPGGLGLFSNGINLINHVPNASSIDPEIISFNIVCWIVLYIPISLLGLLMLLFRTKNVKLIEKRSVVQSNTSILNKLNRDSNISNSMLPFLENFYSNTAIGQVVADREAESDFALKGFFKGGSKAATLLSYATVDGTDQLVVSKIGENSENNSLKDQYDWLRRFNSPRIVKALDEKYIDNFYEIEIEYDESCQDGFDYIHTHSFEYNKKFYDEVIDILMTEVHTNLKKATADPSLLNAYINEHIYKCIQIAQNEVTDLVDAQKTDKIIINGVIYDNLQTILDKILASKTITECLMNYRNSGILHGDVILDNIIFSNKKDNPVLIDPVPKNNFFEGPIFDFGKICQSLHCGYEHLLREESLVRLMIDEKTGLNKINYFDNISYQYFELDSYFMNAICFKYLTDSEQKAVLFHGAVNYLRRLKHQVFYCPENALKFYAVGVKTLNEFYNQFNESTNENLNTN